MPGDEESRTIKRPAAFGPAPAEAVYREPTRAERLASYSPGVAHLLGAPVAGERQPASFTRGDEADMSRQHPLASVQSTPEEDSSFGSYASRLRYAATGGR